jgi:hypothetical protein
MAPKGVRITTLIMKVGLFDWNVMLVSMKNVISIFSRIMNKVFGKYMDKFLKVSLMTLTFTT